MPVIVYAREMGVPIDMLICASNSNNVLTDFIRTGVYDRNREFYNTMSPSMDILISSNLERLLFALTQDTEEVKGYMKELSAAGRYQVRDRVREKLQKRFKGYFCDDKETQRVIREMYDDHGYLIDTHTAVAFSALEQYRADCLTPGNQVQLITPSSRQEAFAVGIDDQFRLVVEYPDGRRATLSSGEVSVRGMYGYV